MCLSGEEVELKSAIEQCAGANRILILKTNLLGDVLNFLPVANFFRKFAGSAKISWLVSRTGYPVVSELAEVDEILLLDDKLLYNYGDLFRIAGWLREKPYDLLVTSYQEECFLIGSLAFLSRARIRIGSNFRNRGWFFNIKIPKGGAKRRVEINGQIIRTLGGKLEDFIYVPRASAKGQAEFEARLLREFGLKKEDAFCVLHLFSNKPTKSWRMEYGEELIRRIQEELLLIPVLVGSEEETKRFGDDQRNLGLINLTGQINLLELYYLLKRAKLFIGIDSFPLQLTEFCGTKAIALFGSTDADENQVPVAELVKAEVECAPCWPAKTECDQGYKCWLELLPDRILESARRVLVNSGA